MRSIYYVFMRRDTFLSLESGMYCTQYVAEGSRSAQLFRKLCNTYAELLYLEFAGKYSPCRVGFPLSNMRDVSKQKNMFIIRCTGKLELFLHSHIFVHDIHSFFFFLSINVPKLHEMSISNNSEYVCINVQRDAKTTWL